MPYKTKTDLTKKAIKESFLKLLCEKPISQITIKDIADGCGFNRNTIYYHYDDLPGLVEEIALEAAERIIKDYSDYSSLEACLDTAVSFALQHKREALNIYNSSNRNVYELYLMNICEHVVESYIETVFGDVPVDMEKREILVRFYKCECFGQIINWMNYGMNYDITEQFHSLCELRQGFAETLVERCRTDK